MRFDPESNFSHLMHMAYAPLLKKLEGLDTPSQRYSRRLVQRISNHNHAKIIKSLREKYKNNLDQANPEAIAQIVTHSAHEFDLMAFFKSLIRYLIIWTGSFFYLLIRKIINKKNCSKIFIIDSSVQTFSEPNIFFKIFDERIVSHLPKENYTFIAKWTSRLSVSSDQIVCKQPIIESIKFISISLSDFYYFFKFQCSSLFHFIKLLMLFRPAHIITNDFLTYPYIKLLDHKKVLGGFLKSNSEYQDQQFWLESKDKNFPFYTMWYATNTITIKTTGLESYDWYMYYFSYFENSLTWTQEHAKWLARFNKNKIIITNPLVFHKRGHIERGENPYIMIFDIPPFEGDYIKDLLWNYNDMLYTEINCKKFIKDIIDEVKSNLPNVEILIKSKRVAGPHHIKSYFEYLMNEETIGNLKIVSPEISAEDLICSAKLVISMPYTSTNQIAGFHKIPAIYYDPSGKLNPEGFFNRDRIQFAQSKEQLGTLLKTIL